MTPVTPKDPQIYTFKAPKGNSDVLDLPGVALGFPDGRSGFYSMWKPSEEELKALNAGHCVLVGILNNGQPIFPIEIGVCKEKDTILEYTAQS